MSNKQHAAQCLATAVSVIKTSWGDLQTAFVGKKNRVSSILGLVGSLFSAFGYTVYSAVPESIRGFKHIQK